MRPRRNRRSLEQNIEAARTSKAKARAHFNLALFHDNNSREAEAIPHYKQALASGLDTTTKAQALAWLASSLYKTGQPKTALRCIAQSWEIADPRLRQFLQRLRARVEKAR